MTTTRDVTEARAILDSLELLLRGIYGDYNYAIGFAKISEFIAAALSERERETAERCAKVADALRILLASHDCLAPDGRAEIPEELSARFDIGLDEARQVCAALEKKVD